MKYENKTILIVEDEIFASKYLLSILKSLGVKTIFEVSNAQDALQKVKENKIDLAFMDININGAIDGIKCASLLNEEYFLPIIYTTAYNDSDTITEASNSNIFSYIVKPFEVHDIQAALLVTFKMLELKNSQEKAITQAEDIFYIDEDLIFNLENKTIYKNEVPISITKKEQDLLFIFCKNVNQNISYEQLKSQIWENNDIANSTIRDAISRLKKKIPQLDITNISNMGYILKAIP